LNKVNEEVVEANIKNSDGTVLQSLPIEMDFTDFNYQSAVQGNLNYPVRVDMCYKYETTVVSRLCVKEDFRRDNTDDLCQVSASRTTFNSAGPIQVVSLTQSAATSDTTRFVFKVQNSDLGDVYQTDSECS